MIKLPKIKLLEPKWIVKKWTGSSTMTRGCMNNIGVKLRFEFEFLI
jgi:hypothetical protein